MWKQSLCWHFRYSLGTMSPPTCIEQAGALASEKHAKACAARALLAATAQVPMRGARFDDSACRFRMTYEQQLQGDQNIFKKTIFRQAGCITAESLLGTVESDHDAGIPAWRNTMRCSVISHQVPTHPEIRSAATKHGNCKNRTEVGRAGRPAQQCNRKHIHGCNKV